MILEDLNPQQEEAVKYNGRNLLVLAGAGTGKTRTIISRAKYLIDSGVHPERILILSFTKKSAREIVARLQSSTSKDTRGLKGQTFHSWCMDILTRNPAIFNFGKFTVIDEEDRESAFRLVCGRHFKKSNFIDPRQLAEVYSYVINARCNLSTALSERLFNGNMDDDTKEKIIKKLPIFQDVIHKYLRFKADRHYLDYDDILQKVAVGLRKNSEAATFIASAYDHILIDEMQDTNPLQYLLLESFWDKTNLFCVGDDAQSIYGFRGADFNSIHHFRLIVPDSDVKKLTLNYRSTQEILDLSNWMLGQSPLQYDKMLIAHRGKGEMPLICHFTQEWDEARDIVMRIKNAQGEEKCPFNENMVLSRSNRGLKNVEACLIEAKIPYVLYGGTGLMASAHIRDIVSALRVVANPNDELAWNRYLCLFPRIGEITAAKIIDRLLDQSGFEDCIKVLKEDHTIHPDIAVTLENIKMLEIEVSRAIEAAFRGLKKILEHRYKDDWTRRSNDLSLLEKIAATSDSLTSFISDYVLDPSLETGLKNGDNPEDCVILTTIHSAKGLEARNCYLVNVNYTSYPSPRAVANGDEAIEEDRRCLYVALTRAKDRLIIYRNHRAAHVIDPFNPDQLEASKLYFLNGIPENLYKIENIDHSSSQWGKYTGESITFDDATEFDFS